MGRGATEVAPSPLAWGQERDDVHFTSNGESQPTNEVDFGQADTRAGHRKVNAGRVLKDQSFTVTVLKVRPADPRDLWIIASFLHDFVILL